MAIDLSGRSLIVGLGATGLSVVRYLKSGGHELRVVDSRARPPGLAELSARFPEVDPACGSLDASRLHDVERVIVSPGLSHDHPLIVAARRRGLPIINDIELFAHAATAPVIAVTGSNGKSTVASLVATMLAAQGFTAPAGGNLGPPALDLLATRDVDVFVLEISSFQMEAVESLRPFSAAVLNVSADHLDRHRSIAAYAALKEKLLAGAARAVVNWDDPLVRQMGRRHDRPIRFSALETLDHGYCLVGRDGRDYLARNAMPVLAADALTLAGAHNRLNALAALALVDTLGGDSRRAVDALRAYRGLSHRCELVARRRGVTYINDSKATNVGATIAALHGFAGPLVLIAGGDGKGADFSPLAAIARDKIRTAILLGTDAGRLEHALEHSCPTLRVESMEDAVAEAAALAQPGDTVMLSPACSSLDMFADYKARGSAFVAAVERLGS
jgi:UDP-N-acetylmuramoylalanine--D-glutamate ligase